MIRRCPRCDEPVPWRLRVRGKVWPCGRCGIRLRRLDPAPKSAERIAWLSMALAALLLALGAYFRIDAVSGGPPLAVIIGFVGVVLALGCAGQIALQRCVIDGPHCPVCLYDLTGSPNGTCPECGDAPPTAAAPPSADRTAS